MGFFPEIKMHMMIFKKSFRAKAQMESMIWKQLNKIEILDKENFVEIDVLYITN